MSGQIDYVKNSPSDGVPDWNALLDAQAFYERDGDSVQAMATNWGQRAKTHYENFYLVRPQRVRDMASINSERVLVDAFFTGWNREGDVPLLVWEKVYLDEGSFPTIRVSSQVLPFREVPYTSNGLTQELIEGNTDRTRSVAKKWQSASRRVAKGERHWRWVEFLIRSTHDYEEDVGQSVNVLQILPGHKAKWLQNLTCSK